MQKFIASAFFVGNFKQNHLFDIFVCQNHFNFHASEKISDSPSISLGAATPRARSAMTFLVQETRHRSNMAISSIMI